MAKYIVIKDNAGKRPPHALPVPAGMESHQVAEAYQEKLARAGYPTGVTWQAVEGTIVDALVATTKLP